MLPALPLFICQRLMVLKSVAILFHPMRTQAVTEAAWLATALTARGVPSTAGSGWDLETVDALCCDRELVVVLGGDGTIIRVSRLASRFDVPLLGINLGRVGFLAEMTPEVLHVEIDAVAEGRFWVEQRAMLDVEVQIGSVRHRSVCLNEIAVARGIAPRAIHVSTMLDDEQFMTYTADGVLVATATGSTAYSLAAGGPILYPESRDFMLTPVAPHLHIGRSMIIPWDTAVCLELASDRPAVVSVDGAEEHNLHIHDRVEVRHSDLVARFARLGPRRYFYAAIADRLK